MSGFKFDESELVVTEEMKRPFQKGDMKHCLLEESSFSVLFPHYREKYLTQEFPRLKSILDDLGIAVEMDAKEGVLTVRTTDKTWDPFAIIKCRDMIRLLARSVPIEQAKRVLEDGVDSMITVIGRDIRNVEQFAKRRQRLIGPNGDTLKALELLTKCYILVQGHTVAAIGEPRGLETVRKIATDCMKNIHPVYQLKVLMVKKELEKRPELANEDWDRYLPKFVKLTKQTKRPKIKKEKKDRVELPEYPQDTEIDRQIESGEYFRKAKGNERKRRRKEKEDKQVETTISPPKEREVLKQSQVGDDSVPSAAELAKSLASK